jgi:hypothetical protein
MLTLDELEPRLVLTVHRALSAVTSVVLHNATVFINPPARGEAVTVADDGNGTLTVATSHKGWRFSESQIQQIVYTGHGSGQFTNRSGVQAYADGGGGRSVLVGQEGDVLIHALAIAILPAPQGEQPLSATRGLREPGGVVAQTPQQLVSLLAGMLPPQEYAAIVARLLPAG